MKTDNQDPRKPSAGGTMNGNLSNAKYEQQSENDARSNEEYPGYPHYPPSEDIMNPANQFKRVSVDVENLAPAGSLPNQQSSKSEAKADQASTIPVHASTDDDINIVPGTEADVTREDLHLLNATEGPYAETSGATTVTGEDLDVPGADQDDPNEDIGEEDEENNYYSLGGDNHENLEEDPS
jgi:hypothetical protein